MQIYIKKMLIINKKTLSVNVQKYGIFQKAQKNNSRKTTQKQNKHYQKDGKACAPREF